MNTTNMTTPPDNLIAQHIGDRPWSQTVTGRAVPLIDPQPSDIHWPDVCYALAHIHRYAGHAASYSVAQHTLHALPYVSDECAPYWLLHDAHEYVLSDIPTPVGEALAQLGDRGMPGSGFAVAGALRCLKNELDYAIYSSVGLEWPLPGEIVRTVHETDLRMLMTERRDLLGPAPMTWGSEVEGVNPFPGVIATCWPAHVAYYELSRALRKLLAVVVPPMSETERFVEHRLEGGEDYCEAHGG